MLGRPGPRRPVGDTVTLLSGGSDEIFERLILATRVGAQNERKDRDRRDHLEALDASIGQGFVHGPGHCMPARDEHEGVTIGRRAGHKIARDRAACTRLGFDHDGLAELPEQFMTNQSRHRIRISPWRKTLDDPNRPTWILVNRLSLRTRPDTCQDQGRQGCGASLHHRLLHSDHWPNTAFKSRAGARQTDHSRAVIDR